MSTFPPSITAIQAWAKSILGDEDPKLWLTVARPGRPIKIGKSLDNSPVQVEYVTPESAARNSISIVPEQDDYVPGLNWLIVEAQGVRLYYQPDQSNNTWLTQPNVLVIPSDTNDTLTLRENCGVSEHLWVNKCRIMLLTDGEEISPDDIRLYLRHSKCRSVRSFIAARELKRKFTEPNEARDIVKSLLVLDDINLLDLLSTTPEFQIIAKARRKRRSLLQDVLVWL